MSDPVWILATREALGPLISKPPLKTKHLSRPPFRFIHDVVANLSANTGFPQGLFSDHEKDGKKLAKDKEGKTKYFKKLLTCVKLCLPEGETVRVKISKMLSGTDCQKTNGFLVQLAQVASRVKAGELEMSNILIGMKTGKLPSKKPKPKPQAKETPKPKKTKSASPAPAPNQEPIPPPKEKTKTPEAAPAPPLYPALPVTDLDAMVKLSQETLSKLITRPKMAEKFLKRPPYRFIHDIVRGLIAATGFPEGFTDEELDLKLTKDKAMKSRVVQKLIKLVSEACGEQLPTLAKKVLSGFEPEKTNFLLIRLGQCAAKKLNAKPKTDLPPRKSSKAAKRTDPPAATKPATKPAPKPAPKPDPKPAPKLEKPSPKREQSIPAKEPEKKHGKIPRESMSKNLHKESQKPVMSKLDLTDVGQQQEPDPSQLPTKKFNRPKTARRPPPKAKSNVLDERQPSAEDADASHESRGIIAEEQIVEQPEEVEPEEPEELGPAFTITEEDTTAVAGEQGKLVRDILKSEKRQSGIKLNTRLGSGHGRSSVTAPHEHNERITALRNDIQKLCQNTLPLGKCIDFVFDDTEQMCLEDARFLADARKYTLQCEKERTITQQLLSNLHEQLAGIEEAIAQKEIEIRRKKMSIMNNENELETLLDFRVQQIN